MTASIADHVLDAALNAIRSETNAMLVCTSEPSDRASALAASTGSQSFAPNTAFGPPQDATDGNGRRILFPGSSIMTLGSQQTVTHWAAISATELLAHGPMADPVLPQTGDVVIGAFWLTLPDH